jgi:hypothetical protein
VGECLELDNHELFDQQLKNNTRTRTCKKLHLKLTKIPTRIESFKEPKTQFRDTASLAHCEDQRPDQRISVPSRTEESQPKLIEPVSSTRKQKTEATKTGSSGLTGRSHRMKNSERQRRRLGWRTADNSVTKNNTGTQREPNPMRKCSRAERGEDWMSARLRDGTVMPNDEPGRALMERGKLTRERHGEDQPAAHPPTEKDGRQNKIGSQDRIENNRHQMQIKSIQAQENRRPAFGTEIRGRWHGINRWPRIAAR